MEPALWAVASGLLLAILLKGVPWMVRSAVEDVVERELEPLSVALQEHMASEDEAMYEIRNAMAEIRAQFHANEIEHAAMDGRLRRLEGGTA